MQHETESLCEMAIFILCCKVWEGGEPKQRKAEMGGEIRNVECGMLSQLWMRQYNYDMEMMPKEES